MTLEGQSGVMQNRAENRGMKIARIKKKVRQEERGGTGQCGCPTHVKGIYNNQGQKKPGTGAL